jgi:hypothetical protein
MCAVTVEVTLDFFSSGTRRVAEAGLADWADLLRAVAWPLVGLLGLLFLAFSRQFYRFVARLTHRARRVSVFGVELELTEEAAAEFREVTQEGLQDYRRLIKTEFDREVNSHLLEQRLQNVTETQAVPLITEFADGKRPSFRATVHVPDILFKESLYQLVDYYPRGRGGRSGRTFSARFGILGKAWRSGESQVEREVTTERQALIRDWGMTVEEATEAGQGRKSFAAILLRDGGGTAIGILYMDAEDGGVFGSEPQDRARFARTVEEACKKAGLTSAVAELVKKLGERGPAIQIYDS